VIRIVVMSIPIVFLDFDGVLSVELERPEAAGGPPGVTAYKFSPLLPEKMELLNELVRRAGARVVVSSSWRRGKDRHQMYAIMRKHGFQGPRYLEEWVCVDVTPVLDGILPGAGRGHEIACYR